LKYLDFAMVLRFILPKGILYEKTRREIREISMNAFEGKGFCSCASLPVKGRAG
jgi:hypothetical protein